MSYESSCKRRLLVFYNVLYNWPVSEWECCHESIWHGVEFTYVRFETIEYDIFLVPTPEDFEIENGLTDNLIRAMIAREAYIALGEVGTNYLIETFVDFTNSYYTLSLHWLVSTNDQ
jgi:hypothetical protein